MVVFTCGHCNESLKKNQVEKHYQSRCRNCNVLSCVDCGKEFWGDAYKEHIKCISEEEKYSGKNYKPKPNANKGEVKQEQWLQKVQFAIDKCMTNPRLKGLLERMKDYPNIPRKKAKFENFVGNSMNVRDKRLVSEVWDLLLANTEQQPSDKNEASNSIANGDEEVKKSEVNGSVTDKDRLKELSKKERKAERKRVKDKNKNTSENCDKLDNTVQTDTGNTEMSDESEDRVEKKSKNRKRKNTEEDDATNKKRHIDEDKNDESTLNTTTEDDVETDTRKKFNWEETITALLSSKGEISIKKLKKKVFAEYQAHGGKPRAEERLIAKLNKKINKNANFVVKKERVRLKTSK